MKSGGRGRKVTHTCWLKCSKGPSDWIKSRATGQLNLQDNLHACLGCRNSLSLSPFLGNCKRQKSQEIKHNRCFHFCLVTSAHQRNQSCCVCPVNASLNFHFHGYISRDNQKVEQAGFVGHNHWSSFIFVWLRPLKIHWVEGILPVSLVESSAILRIFWSL